MENGNGTENKSGENQNTNTDPNASKITFSTEQQEHVNNVVKERLARQAASLRTDFDKSLNEKLEALRTELAAKKTEQQVNAGATEKEKEEESKRQQRELIEAEQRKTETERKRAQELDRQLKETQATNKQILKHNAIQSALKGIGFHSPDEVELLIDKYIEEAPDGKGYVVKVNGVVKENASLEPMSIADYMREWAGARPWAVDSKLVGGAGSTPNGSAGENGQVKTKADLKTWKEKSDYISKFGLDQFSKLPMGEPQHKK
jgi:hypothetical protein